MRGELELEILTQNIINYLAEYLNAQVGVFYLLEDERLKLVSSYAYKMRNVNYNQFKLGEGMVGQAALERKSILFTEVPEDHVQVTINSGMGESIPRSILVIPLIFEDRITGVLGLGTSHDFSSREMELFDMVAESIAITLNSAQARLRMRKLLEQIQRQAGELQTQQEELQASNEELQTQQEELKQANEELETQTEALQTSEEELRASNEELQQTNDALEEKSKQLTLQNEEVAEKNREVELARTVVEEKAQQLAITSKYKSEFLANMSHELRTPLNSLLVLSKLLKDNKQNNLTEKQVEFADVIYESGNDLLNLLNDILDLSKIEAGKIEIKPGAVDLNELTEQMEQSYRVVAEQKKLKFEVKLQEQLPALSNCLNSMAGPCSIC